ncbi:MAG: hypothetical protein K2W95_28870 [Candidatus Obscuribacterales bacterium]|nr:hypothetical protein [Candidatus Obscuribacterales bacterium]
MADLNVLLSTLAEKKAARGEAKSRYDRAESALQTHGTDNHNDFVRAVHDAYHAYEEAHNGYLSAARDILNAIHDPMYAAQEEFEPACILYGTPNYEHC